MIGPSTWLLIQGVENPATTALRSASMPDAQPFNSGLLLVALRHPRKPTGMHFQLQHFDVPWLDAASYTLGIRGLVRKLLSLNLDDLQRRSCCSQRVLLACAGNGRAKLNPRTVSCLWQDEVAGCAAWTGTPFLGVLEGCADPASISRAARS